MNDDPCCYLRIAARVCLLLLLLTARRVFFMIEQPFSSKLALLPLVRDVFDMIREIMPLHRVFLPSPLIMLCDAILNVLRGSLYHDQLCCLSWMGNYGHFSCKGSLAYSNLSMPHVSESCNHYILYNYNHPQLPNHPAKALYWTFGQDTLQNTPRKAPSFLRWGGYSKSQARQSGCAAWFGTGPSPLKSVRHRL